MRRPAAKTTTKLKVPAGDIEARRSSYAVPCIMQLQMCFVTNIFLREGIWTRVLLDAHIFGREYFWAQIFLDAKIC